MKRFLSVFLVCIMLSTFVACGDSGSTTTDKTANPASTVESAASTADTQAAVQAPAELSVVVAKHPLTKPLTQMQFLKTIEEKANVKVNWMEYDSATWTQKKSVVLASKDLPDVFMGQYTITDTDIATFPGVFETLDSLIDTNGPNIKKMFSEIPLTKSLSTQADGKIYSVGLYKGIWPETWCRMVINKTWLDKLKLQVPTTWDELYTVLKAFKTGDPNGNGEADEIPINWDGSNLDGFNITTLLGGYGLLSSNSDNGYFINNGKVSNKYADPRMKELVVFLNKLNNDHLINPQVFTDDYTKFKALGRSPNVPVLGVGFGWDLPGVVGTEWADQYVTVGPLKPNASYNGPMYAEYSFDMLNYGTTAIAMTQKCEDKEAAMRLIDAFYDPEISLQVLFGSEGECITKNSDGTFTILPPADPKMDAGTWKWTNGIGDQGAYYISPSLKIEYDYVKNIANLDTVYTPYNDTVKKTDIWPRIFIKYSKEDGANLGIIDTNVTNIMKSMFAQWVSSGGVEKRWDKYLKDLDNAGYQESLKIRQSYYDNYLKTLQ